MHPVARIVPVLLCTLAAPLAHATFNPVSASRSVMSGFPAAPITSSAMGPFNQSQSGSAMGGGSQPQTVFGTASQNSNIDALLNPPISANLSVSGGSTGGSPTNMTGTPTSSFILTFQITGADTLVHTLVPTGIGSVATLTPQGQSAINLLGPGVNNIPLTTGSYTLFLQMSQVSAASLGGSSFTGSLVGTISFVPAPGAAALLGLAGLTAARRRRR